MLRCVRAPHPEAVNAIAILHRIAADVPRLAVIRNLTYDLERVELTTIDYVNPSVADGERHGRKELRTGSVRATCDRDKYEAKNANCHRGVLTMHSDPSVVLCLKDIRDRRLSQMA